MLLCLFTHVERGREPDMTTLHFLSVDFDPVEKAQAGGLFGSNGPSGGMLQQRGRHYDSMQQSLC